MTGPTPDVPEPQASGLTPGSSPTGRAWVYGDDVNTDVIFPGKYTYTIQDEAEMARHALEDLDPRLRRTCSRAM
jgi:3-isopropylmalate dehydratase small subunit